MKGERSWVVTPKDFSLKFNEKDFSGFFVGDKRMDFAKAIEGNLSGKNKTLDENAAARIQMFLESAEGKKLLKKHIGSFTSDVTALAKGVTEHLDVEEQRQKEAALIKSSQALPFHQQGMATTLTASQNNSNTPTPTCYKKGSQKGNQR